MHNLYFDNFYKLFFHEICVFVFRELGFWGTDFAGYDMQCQVFLLDKKSGIYIEIRYIEVRYNILNFKPFHIMKRYSTL